MKDTLQTDFGPLDFHLNGKDFVGLNGEIVVNRVTYNVTARLTLANSYTNVWTFANASDLYMSRPGTWGEPSSAARRKLREALPLLWAEYIKDKPALLVEAQRERLENQLVGLRANIREWQKQIEQHMRQIATIEREVMAL